MLLPIAAWRQWAVKAAVVLVLSLGLAIAVPAILYALFASGPGPVRLGWPPAAAIAAVATVSLYASSLSTNGVRALLASLPAIVGVAADRTEVPAPRRNFDERVRTHVAFEVEDADGSPIAARAHSRG